ncbi:hypothetical protein LX73_2299 [Fodinibius salinus]|uniref:Uncharacterized protein n=1 Tax=Fodinibius salinus TaxID=860790 RepID=A0A5D3YGC1_9BACT|nr:hypothetical protein [Fodinibius salinus]TYP92053.1 hypothetical protein LX73_2299 [Fodinibius salinus]
MTDTGYLILDKNGIAGFKKTARGAENCGRNEIPVKVEVSMDESKFNKPYPTKKIHVTPWDKDIGIEDIHFEDSWITEEEEQMIRERRLEKYEKVLRDQGYKVEKIEDEEE